MGELSKISVSRKLTARNVRAMSLFGMGVPEIAIIAGVAALVFGASKLPELGKTLGKSAKSLQQAAKEFEKELKSETSEDLSESRDRMIRRIQPILQKQAKFKFDARARRYTLIEI